MFLNLLNFNNMDLLFVGIVAASTSLLGFIVFLNDKKSITSRTFLYFSLVTTFWGVVNYFSYKVINPVVSLWLLRFILFSAVFQAFFLYRLFLVFPNKTFSFSKFYKRFLIPLVSCVALITLTPLTFSKVIGMPVLGEVANTEKGPGMLLFGVLAVSLVFSSFYVLFFKIKHTESESEKKALKLISIGVILMFCLIIFFNLILAVLFSNTKFVPFGALFTFPFIIFTFYAISKHNVFKVKVLSVGFVALILTIFSFFNIVFATNTSQIVLNVTFFILILIGSVTLIRTILREVEQKEYLQALNKELQDLVKQRESLVHLITHKVKGSFTRSKYLFAEMLEGTFGKLAPDLEMMTKKGLQSDIDGIATVDLVLNSSNLQKGIVKYDMKEIDFREIVESLVDEKKVTAESKGLKMEKDIKEGDYTVLGDAFWLKDVVVNLLENSIRYTKEGSITVGLERKDKKILLSVKDTGIGITDEDKKNLFTEGGRGKESVKVNVDSTGYGLFSVKLVLKDHGGRVWAESEGPGKGSQFYVELDAIDKHM